MRFAGDFAVPSDLYQGVLEHLSNRFVNPWARCKPPNVRNASSACYREAEVRDQLLRAGGVRLAAHPQCDDALSVVL
jgi:hypothetical protein